MKSEEKSDGPQWLTHLDKRWMWRWFLTDVRGQMLAASKVCFFRREDAESALARARTALRSL
ncbi:MAG: hypothetical protein JWM38_1890 [Sphingomonas bacterium]|nr:hypothetical protein [Sphingomonas bacterium]